MKRLRVLAVGLLGLALVAGPVAAACAECCPQEALETAFAALPDCCGDCEPRVAQSKDGPDALAAKAVAQGKSAVAPAGSPSPTSPLAASDLPAGASSTRTHRPPPSAGSPLRL
jgi:hypothetical protein